jgi:hypothetical protein
MRIPTQNVSHLVSQMCTGILQLILWFLDTPEDDFWSRNMQRYIKLLCCAHWMISNKINMYQLQMLKTFYIIRYCVNILYCSTSTLIGISLALRVNVSRILHNLLAVNYQLLNLVQASRTSNGLWSKGSDWGTCCEHYGWTSNYQCSLLSKKYPIIQIFCICRLFAIPINSEKWRSIVLQNHSFTVLIHVIWYIKY